MRIHRASYAAIKLVGVQVSIEIIDGDTNLDIPPYGTVNDDGLFQAGVLMNSQADQADRKIERRRKPQ